MNYRIYSPRMAKSAINHARQNGLRLVIDTVDEYKTKSACDKSGLNLRYLRDGKFEGILTLN